MQELFTEGFTYDGEIRPRGAKISQGYWSADEILKRLPTNERDVCLILTSLELKGDYGRIHGKGHPGKAVVSNISFIGGSEQDTFDPRYIDFQAIVFHELGHTLGLTHHETKETEHCNMTLIHYPQPDWRSLKEIRFCEDCYKQLQLKS